MAIAFFEHGTGGDVALGPAAADGLARLGITSVTVLADSAGVAVVMEGWAFDPRDAAQAADVAARGAGPPPRILYPLSDTSVRPADRKGAPT
jgi:hypothetical protein